MTSKHKHRKKREVEPQVPARALARAETEVFQELETLATSPGFALVIAELSFRDNFTPVPIDTPSGPPTRDYDPDKLIRTELSTLIGLMIKGSVGFERLRPDELKQRIERARALLDELHKAMSGNWLADIVSGNVKDYFRGRNLREPIFYGPESAYSFQYTELAVLKYKKDNTWLINNKGFTIEVAAQLTKALSHLQNLRATLSYNLDSSTSDPPERHLEVFKFNPRELSEATEIPVEQVKAFLDAFTVSTTPTNRAFDALQDFNCANATPILRHPDGSYVLFQHYSLAEALYESPYFWMVEDTSYWPTSVKNRGEYTEATAARFLTRSFAAPHVFQNVTLSSKKGTTIGEIDTLVVFGDRAIVVQAKSKRLTIPARKGNDLQIQEDFKKAVQESYDQAVVCAKALLQPDTVLVDRSHRRITLTYPLTAIHPLCVVADNYPALAFQAQHFLKYDTLNHIESPIVIDLFALDTMTEMLESPVRILSYLKLRSKFGSRVSAMHEHTLLSYHLKRNLWLDSDVDFAVMHDDITSDLDAAMMTRREGMPGEPVPDGILTRLQGTFIGDLIATVEVNPDPATIDLALHLLELGEETVQLISKGVQDIASASRRDGAKHDLTVAFGDAGLTVHATPLLDERTRSALTRHCALRKYSQKASIWFGILVDPNTCTMRAGLRLNDRWTQDDEMDRMVATMPSGLPNKGRIRLPKPKKVGRNDPCPCGSGKKFKKCCLSR